MSEIERSFATEWMLRDDGRTVDGRIVPYNEVADVYERGERYREMFLPDSCVFMEQVAKRRGNAAFIELRLEHEADLRTTIGYARSIENRPDGAYASFRLYERDDIAQVRSMLAESHTGLSIYFADRATPRTEDGIVKRVQVDIKHVAATPVPVYAGAAITGMRGGVADEGTPHLIAVRQYLAELKR